MPSPKMVFGGARYPQVGKKVAGLNVGSKIPNTNSISASFTHYTVLTGVREVPLSSFQITDPHGLFYSKTDLVRVEDLVNAIQESGRIDPLIVVIDAEGLYVLEGAHRLGALHMLGKKKLPALVVVDES